MNATTLRSSYTHGQPRYVSRAYTSLDMTGELDKLYKHGGLYLALPAVPDGIYPTFAIKAPGEGDTALVFRASAGVPKRPHVEEWRHMRTHVPMACWVLLSKPGAVSPRVAATIRNTPVAYDNATDWVRSVLIVLSRDGYLACPRSANIETLLGEIHQIFNYNMNEVRRSTDSGSVIEVDRNCKLQCCRYFSTARVMS